MSSERSCGERKSGSALERRERQERETHLLSFDELGSNDADSQSFASEFGFEDDFSRVPFLDRSIGRAWGVCERKKNGSSGRVSRRKKVRLTSHVLFSGRCELPQTFLDEDGLLGSFSGRIPDRKTRKAVRTRRTKESGNRKETSDSPLGHAGNETSEDVDEMRRSKADEKRTLHRRRRRRLLPCSDWDLSKEKARGQRRGSVTR